MSTKVGVVLVLGGLVWLGAEYAENRKRPSRLKVPTEAELSVVDGTAASARVVEHKTKKGVLASRYTELDIQAAGASTTVRLVDPNSERVLSGIGGQTVKATYDPREQNFVYALSATGRSLISYQDTAAYKSQVAESESGGYTAGWIAVALGIAGVVLGRRLSGN